MSNSDKLFKLDDTALGRVAGGAQKAYLAALDLMNGKYGEGDECRARIEAEGLDYWAIRHMANGLAQGYDKVVQDVIDGKYGNHSSRYKALAQQGYDARLVQDIINGMLLDD